MSEIEKANTADDEIAPKKGGLKKLILLLVAVVVLVVGVGGGYFLWRSRTAAAAEIKKASDKKSQAKKDSEDNQEQDAALKTKKQNDPLQNALPEDEDVKKIVELPPFIVNLADTEQARYLRMTVSLGVDGSDGASEKPDQLFITRVRNAMLAVLSDKKSDDILTVDGKAKLRKELLQAAQAASSEPQVKAIYITDFIVQL